ncbi:MAG TPA: phosphoglycerate kinase [Candidatus Eisenbacteria bacterium]|nr:phosphoglycerate kinase [Candidatus Eisenbacteria bacterium]
MIREVGELALEGKTVFLRVDFNVPIAGGKVAEAHRIESALPTIRLILARARKLVLASHLGRPDGKVVAKYSLAPVRDHLEALLGESVALAPAAVGAEAEAMVRRPDLRVVLLENLRFHEGEEANDPAFARALAALADVYVNDAFGAAHRAHASIAAITAFFREKAAGLLMHKELTYLSRVISGPEKPFVLILGGAKVSDKIGVIKNLLPKVNSLLIGGGMAYTFLKARGVEVGMSLLEEDKIGLARELMLQAARAGANLALPEDHVTGDSENRHPQISGPAIAADRRGLDIGPKTIATFSREIEKARTVLWNGPVGLFELEPYDRGTSALARVLADNHPRLVSVIAGGDTVAAVSKAGVEDRITHLSTGGGATLEYLEGRELPGIAALEERR